MHGLGQWAAGGNSGTNFLCDTGLVAKFGWWASSIQTEALWFKSNQNPSNLLSTSHKTTQDTSVHTQVKKEAGAFEPSLCPPVHEQCSAAHRVRMFWLRVSAGALGMQPTAIKAQALQKDKNNWAKHHHDIYTKAALSSCPSPFLAWQCPAALHWCLGEDLI